MTLLRRNLKESETDGKGGCHGRGWRQWEGRLASRGHRGSVVQDENVLEMGGTRWGTLSATEPDIQKCLRWPILWCVSPGLETTLTSLIPQACSMRAHPGKFRGER